MVCTDCEKEYQRGFKEGQDLAKEWTDNSECSEQ